MSKVRELDHPLARHCLARLRDKRTEPEVFRTLSRRLTTLLAVEATKHLKTRVQKIETPLEEVSAQLLDDPLVVIPILRAGLGMLEGVVALFPNVTVGYLGLERDEETARASVYYSKLPPLEGKTVLLVDPMLATGGSASHALGDIFSQAPARVVMLCIVSAPEGIEAVSKRFPELEIVTAAVDRELDSRKFILPGLGDFGDRLWGTA